MDWTQASEVQVRAWLKTVLGPLIDGLAAEASHLVRRRWGFRPSDQQLEYVQRVADMVPQRYWPNLEQLKRFEPPLVNDFRLHDSVAVALLGAAVTAFGEVMADEAFLRLTADRVPKRPVLAEYLVNNVDHLPEYYALHEDWQQIGRELMDLRERDTLRPVFEQLQQAGGSLRAEVERLVHKLTLLRNDMADRHRLPAVDPDAA